MLELALDSSKRIRKRKYSRNGCKECKRRKIKCDETVPECNNCTRLKKACEYDHSMNLAKKTDLQQKGPGTLRVKMYRSSFETSPPENAAEPSPASVAAVDSKPSPKHTITFVLNNGVELEPQASPEEKPPASSNGGEGLTIDMPAAESFETQDLLGLFNRASDLVHDMSEFLVPMDADNASNNSAGVTPHGHYTPLVPQSGEMSESSSSYRVDMSEYELYMEPRAFPSPNGVTERLLLSNSELIKNCVAEHTLTEPHVEYLKTLTTTDLSYHIFPYASLIESNQGVKLLLIYLAKCPYLLSSLLAISATFQFNQTGKLRHDRARQTYTARCLKALSGAFAEYSSFSDPSMLASNIELLLLTILVLSSCFTATKYTVSDNYLNQWQTHLKGARDLLIDYSQKTKFSGGPLSLYMTSGLAFAKSWFFAIESSAVLHTTVGRPFLQAVSGPELEQAQGTDFFDAAPSIEANPDYEAWLDTGTTEAKANVNYHNALERAGLICQTQSGADFNLFWGYTSSTVRMIVTLDCINHSIQQRNLKIVPARWTIHLIALIDGLLADTIVPGVTFPTFEVNVPKTEPSVPAFAARCGISEACFSTESLEDGVQRTYSWFDASAHNVCNNMYMRVLTSKYFLGLPRTHPQVQSVLQNITDGFFFIKKKSAPYQLDESQVILQSEHFYLSPSTFDYHCIMHQSMFRIISGVVVDEVDFERIELFFMGLVKLGNGSALSFLDHVIKFKELRRIYRESHPNEIDDEVYDSFSVLTDIPFA